jgi:EmrB/QacA subfamily drug resistance transporter
MTSSSPASAGGSAGGLDRATLAIASVVVLGAIMAILDTTVVNVAINHLTRDLDAPLSTIQWVVTGYMLALATVIPLTGWAAHRFGTKRLYMISLTLFIGGSVLCGLAWSAESLIAFRILQGLGGGMIMPAGMTILTQKAGPQRIGRVMAIVGVPMLLGPIVGPILGGWLVDDVSWRWIFFINLPIGAVALTLALRILPKDEPSPTESLDVVGLALLSPGLATLIYGLAEMGSNGFDSAAAWGFVTLGLALVTAFVLHGLRASNPLIDLRLFQERSVAAAGMTMTLFTLAFFGAMLLLPLYFQTVRGEGAMDTGLLLAPQGLGAMIMMPIAGTLTDRIGPGRIVLVGIPTITATMAVLTQLGAETSYWAIGATLFVMGLGMGATMMPTMSAAFQTLRRAAVPRATTALNIIQQVGGAIGTAILSVLLTGALTDRLPGAATSGSAEGGATAVPPEVREQVAPLMADAFGSVFVWATIFLALAFLPALLLPRRRAEPLHDEEEGAGLEPEVAPVLVHA